MKCPYCKQENNRVYCGVTIEENYKRYRKCRHCGKTFTSLEVYVPDEEVKIQAVEQILKTKKRRGLICTQSHKRTSEIVLKE